MRPRVGASALTAVGRLVPGRAGESPTDIVTSRGELPKHPESNVLGGAPRYCIQPPIAPEPAA